MKVEITKEIGFISYKDKNLKKGDVEDIVKADAERLIKKEYAKPFIESEDVKQSKVDAEAEKNDGGSN